MIADCGVRNAEFRQGLKLWMTITKKLDGAENDRDLKQRTKKFAFT